MNSDDFIKSGKSSVTHPSDSITQLLVTNVTFNYCDTSMSKTSTNPKFEAFLKIYSADSAHI